MMIASELILADKSRLDMKTRPMPISITKHNKERTVRMRVHVDGLVQYCSNSSALAMELLQSCTKRIDVMYCHWIMLRPF